tara:strand:+ start:114 stop:1043 length:930 start_codon:yes stop_codon:yes gene_type:complete
MYNHISNFILQSKTTNLKSSQYPKEYLDLDVKFSFGMGTPAKISWASIHNNEIRNTKGINCVYLFYKEENILILAYGIMEAFVGGDTWSNDVSDNNPTIAEYFETNSFKKPYRYGDSYVFKSYEPKVENDTVSFINHKNGNTISSEQFDKDVNQLAEYYGKIINIEIKNEDSSYSQGLFYMESQLEDFIINNWQNTELGKKYDLIYENGDLISKQYRTDIGIIDILAKDKKNKNHVVIELKRNQTSDDTFGQLTRYMGWVKRHLKDDNVKGIIIAGKYDKKLDYALEYAPFDTEVFIYNVSFTLNEFKK